jgi:hypothetical protein
VFKSIAVGDARLRARYKQQLLEACEGRRQLLAVRVLAAADAAAEALLAEGARQIGTVSSRAAPCMVACGCMGPSSCACTVVCVAAVAWLAPYSVGRCNPVRWLFRGVEQLQCGLRHAMMDSICTNLSFRGTAASCLLPAALHTPPTHPPTPHVTDWLCDECTPQAARVKGSWQEAQAELEAFVGHYTSNATGPSKWPKLVTWLVQQGAGLTQAALARAQVGPWVGTRGRWGCWAMLVGPWRPPAQVPAGCCVVRYTIASPGHTMLGAALSRWVAGGPCGFRSYMQLGLTCGSTTLHTCVTSVACLALP